MPAARDLHPGASPAHFFGAEVRRAREAAGMTLADLGTRVPCDISTVSRIESAILSPTERFAIVCDETFPHMDGWFSRFYNDSRTWEDTYPNWFRDWVKAEREALTLRAWEVELVPGLLQTAEYARAIFRAWKHNSTDDELDEMVNSRLERQDILHRTDPPEIWVVFDESVLHRLIGSAKITHDQLGLLADMYDRPNVTIQVVPAGVGAHAGLLGAFAIASGEGFPDTLYMDTTVQGQTVLDTALVRKAASVFDRLRAESLSRGASQELIIKAMEENHV